MNEIVERVAKAICREQCAFYGDLVCWKKPTGEPDDWPNPTCNEPGCMALARAVVSTLSIRGET